MHIIAFESLYAILRVRLIASGILSAIIRPGLIAFDTTTAIQGIPELPLRGLFQLFLFVFPQSGNQLAGFL
jgi:hypothetical protein